LATVDPKQLKKLGKNMMQAGIPISMVVVVVLHIPQPNRASYKCVIDYFQFEKNLLQGIIGV
jgi:hypothetical protein